MLRKIPLLILFVVAVYLGLALAGLISAADAEEPAQPDSDFDLGQVLGRLLASEPLGDDPTLTAAYLPSELVPRYYEIPLRSRTARSASHQPVRMVDVIDGGAVRKVELGPAVRETGMVKLPNWESVVTGLSSVQAAPAQTGATLADAIAEARWRKSVARKLRNRLN